MDGNLQARSEVLAFLGIPKTGSPDDLEFHRMKGFTSLSTSKNPKEYTRQYVDESQEQTDVVGYSPAIEFGFDKYIGNVVHDYLAEIIDNEVTGTPAVVNILVVDVTKTSAENNAHLRPYAVVADSEGDSMDAYTYSGTFKVKGDKQWGKATIVNDLTATFDPAIA